MNHHALWVSVLFSSRRRRRLQRRTQLSILVCRTPPRSAQTQENGRIVLEQCQNEHCNIYQLSKDAMLAWRSSRSSAEAVRGETPKQRVSNCDAKTVCVCCSCSNFEHKTNNKRITSTRQRELRFPTGVSKREKNKRPRKTRHYFLNRAMRFDATRRRMATHRRNWSRSRYVRITTN